MVKYVAAVDFGGTNVKMALFKNDDLMLFSEYPSLIAVGFEFVLLEMKTKLEMLLDEVDLNLTDVQSMGIALPGIVDVKRKRLVSVNAKYQSAVDFDIEGWVRQNLDMTLALENDANAALLGERSQGSLGESEYAVLFTLGTGVGTAVLNEGKLFRGAHGQAGCLGGHLSIDYNGKSCNCGNIGCLEAHASTWALEGRARNSPKYKDSVLSALNELKLKELFESANDGDTLAKDIREEFLLYWGAGIVNLIHAYDPEIVVLSGGVMQAGDVITESIVGYVNKHAWTPYGHVKIIVSKELKKSVLYGMNFLATHTQEKNN